MRINMWMLANMLKGEDITEEISSGAACDLYGVSFSELPGRVSVSSSGDSVICSYGGDRIIFNGCSFLYAFERIQQVFNTFNEWYDSVIHLCYDGDWQRIVDSVEPMFSNPLVLFDLNKKVIAMSGRFGRGAVDREWDYLLEYGVASSSAIKTGRSTPRFLETLHENPGIYHTAPRPDDRQEYLTICIKCGGEPWGYFSSVNSVGKFSRGEVDALMSLAGIMGSYVTNKGGSSYEDISQNVFKDFLMNPNADGLDSISRMLATYGWSASERFLVICACLFGDNKAEAAHRMYASSLNAFSIPSVIIDDTVTFILNVDNPAYSNTESQLLRLAGYFSVSLVYSLPLSNIRNICYGYDQARFVIDRGGLTAGVNSYFYDSAMDYIISRPAGTAMLYACKQEILRLFMEDEKTDEIALTLELYLKNERSLQKTALELGLHKNTISYRIKRALERTSLELENPYEREYTRLTFSALHVLGY